MDSRPLVVLLTLGALTAALFLAKEFLMPLALAILIVFLLTPVVARLEVWGLSRTVAVVVAAASTFLLIGTALYVVSAQLVDLANALPGYKDNLRAKATAFHADRNGPLGRVLETFHEVSDEFSKSSEEQAIRPAEKPLPVELVNEQLSVIRLLREFVGPALRPLGTAAIVVVFVIFMLLERQELRDRFIHAIGRGRVRVTTQALDDAGSRVSRYLAAQLLVNVTYGVPVGIGLYWIGVPNAILWGMLAVLLRFLPYIGPWIAAIFPIMLSVAVSPGWWPLMATVTLFVVIELISNNVVEPWLYGASTGLSPVAIIVSAAFWTWLWGAGGLLLATPLTVCIAVLGKYVPSLGFLDVLLGDHPPIAPEDRFYQRLLAADETELQEIMESYASRDALGELYDSVIIPALRRAEDDFSRGGITREERHDLAVRVCEALECTAGFPAAEEAVDAVVLIVPARTDSEELAGRMLAHLLLARGVKAMVTSARTLSSEVAERLQEKPWSALCVSVLSNGSIRRAEALVRRLGAEDSGRAFVGTWGREAAPTPASSFTRVGSVMDAARKIAERAQLDSPSALPATVAVAVATHKSAA